MQEWPPEAHTAIAKEIRFQVYRIRQRFQHVDRTEAESAAWFAAVQAMRTYDPAGASSARTWAGIRISGALLDMAKLQVKRARKHAEYLDRRSSMDDTRTRLNAKRDALHILANTRLKPRDREMIRLHYLEGLTLKETAARIGLASTGGTLLEIRRVLARMRRFAESDKTHGLAALRATLTPCPGRKKSRQFCPTL